MSQESVSRQWIAPLLSTLVTIPGAFFAHVFAGLSGMACDSCTAAQADRFEPSFDRALTVFGWGLALSLLVLVTAWVLPWQRRFAPWRIGLAVAAPFVVVFSCVAFGGIVDWP
ncbi:hypothetical protein ABII15_26595 [Streptomyces sp. HUAS MG91]|uniref:Integral membrane protein n=1 Tax=Streptomyces tabacisoli TaxID=3156398 RepID=A0AAU8IYK1_9ACTN